MPGTVRVENLGSLLRIFKAMPVEVQEEFVWELEEAVNPVKLAAQAKAPGSMRNMVHTREWAAMRVKVGRKNPAEVSVIPQLSGRTRRKRTQNQKETFASRMQTLALDPALKENTDKVLKRAEDFIDHLGNKHGF